MKGQSAQLRNLNPRQREFVSYYIGPARKNATEAARLAGYKQPMQQGHDLLRKPEIAAAVADHLREIERKGIAVQQNRIDGIAERHRLLEQIRQERAVDPFYGDVPGGTTGLVLKKLRNVKHTYEADPNDPNSEPRAITAEIWEVHDNTALSAEMTSLEMQIAKELGEWAEKTEISGGIKREYVIVTE